MWSKKASYRFEIDNFSKIEGGIMSHIFVGDGYEWYIYVYPNGYDRSYDHMSVYLHAANLESLPTGWRRSARYYFSVLDQSEKELYRSPIGLASNVFRAESPSWGYGKAMPLSKLREIGPLEKDRLIIEVYIKIVEAFDGERKDVSEKKKETVDTDGFQVFASHAALLTKIVAENPELAKAFKPMDQDKMSVLSNMVNTLQKSQNSLSKTELDKALDEMSEMIYVQLDWFKSNLDKLSLDRKKPSTPDVSLVQERVKNLELMQSGSKVEDVSKKAKAEVQKLEEFVKNIGVMEPKKKKSYDACASNEERIKNLEQMVSDLKVEVEKNNAKSSDDGFFLVNKVDSTIL